MKYLKPLVSVVLILALAVGGFLWLKATKPQVQTPTVQEKTWPVAAMSVELETLRPERTVFAQVSVPQQVRLQAPFAGWVEAVPVKPGMTVAPGDLLVRLDDTDARALLTQAQADVADLEAQIRIEQMNLAAQKKLVARKLANELSVEQLQAKLAQLNARLEKARARLVQVQRDVAKAVMRADTPLRIVAVKVGRGERVAPGQLLLSAYDPADLELAVVVPDALWRRVATRADQLRLVDAAGRRYPFARVAAERTPLGVKLWFSAADTPLTLGDLKKLILQLPPVAQVVAVPYSALYGEDHVYVVEAGRLRRVSVTWLGEITRQAQTLALVQGLSEGQQVLTTHLPNAIDGLRVSVQGAQQP